MSSRRFQTTTQAAQEAALEHGRQEALLLSGGREAVVRRLQEQKELNTRTNLVLGSDTVIYESEAAAGLRGPVERDPAAFRRRRAPAEAFALKQALQRPHFYLGDRPAAAISATGKSHHDDDDGCSVSYSSVSSDGEEEDHDDGAKAMYVPTSRQADPTGELEAYRGQLNAEVKKRIATSSVHWGQDRLSYETTQRAFFHHAASSSNDKDDVQQQEEELQLMRRQRKQEIAALKRALTATHFRLEDGNGEVGSDSSRKLQPQKEGHGRLLSLPPVKTLKELRALGSSHFTFCEAGDCPEDRQASVMGAATAATAAATAAGGVGVGERERGRARELKRELTASRIVLGVDPAYA